MKDSFPRVIQLGRRIFPVVPLLLLVTASGGAQRPAPIEELQRRAIADSNDPMAHYQLAMGFWEKKKWDEAEQALHTAARLSPTLAEGWLALSELSVERGERYWKRFGEHHGQRALDSALTQARLYRQRAFLTNPLMDLGILGRFRASSRVTTPIGLEFHVWWASDFEKGVNALRQARNEEAYLLFEKILRDERAGADRNTIPWVILWHHGQAAARGGHLVEAIEDFATLTGRARARELIDETPADRINMTFQQLLGQIFTDHGLEERTNEFRYMLGMLYFMSGQLNQAIGVFRRVLELDVGVYQAHVQLARIYEAVQLWPEAVAARRSAVATNPDDHTLLIDLGATLMKGGQLEEAVTVLDQAVHLGPRDPRGAYTLGLAAIQKEDYAAARAALTRYLALAPSSESYQIAEAHRRLAELPPDHLNDEEAP